MDFYAVLDQVVVLLHQRGRLTYGALKRQFQIDDDYLADLKAELIEGQRVAVDEGGKVLVWKSAAADQETAKQHSGETEPKPTPSEADSGTDKPRDPRPPEGERRQLTVMFIDLVGSTTLSHQLDPEDYHARVVAYQTACHRVIEQYAGHIAQYLGDGVLAYFGYPAAHEDDAVHAVRSGLEIVAAVHQLAYTPPLQVRIGIHTGPVVVGEIGSGARREMLALGETPNLAARVQAEAEPDAVVLSAATYRLVQGLFEWHDLGPHTLKGISASLSLYRVVRESGVQSRFEAAVRTGLTPLVGREEELTLLRRRWEQAQAGEGQVILLSGEAGIGKSRLVQTLKEQVGTQGVTRIECRCSPYHQNSALYPIIEHLQRFLHFHREESPPAKLDKLQRALARYRFPQPDTVALLAALLSLPHPVDAPPLTLSPRRQKQKTQDALVAWLVEETERQAVLCAWEDLHWADPSTLDLLTLFVEQVPTTRLLALLTCRPEFLPPWRPRSHLTQLTLNRLGHPQVEAMVEKITGGKPLPKEVGQQIVAKTDGVPLFVEELTKMVLESGLLTATDDHYELTSPLPPLVIPSTLQDSLMARLDRLATTREIAQLGATLGREFSYDLLYVVSPLDEATLRQGLRQLVEAELVYQRGVPPQATYLFKHALIQDAAYQSLLKSTRQQYHTTIAHRLEEHFPELTETQPELVGHHYTAAGLIAQALPYWQQAGERATQRSAYVEAVAYFTRGLEGLTTLPDTPEYVQYALTLQLALHDALVTVKGNTAPEVEKAVTQARALCEQLGETPQLFPVLWRLRLIYGNRGEFQTALELAEQCFSLARSVRDPYLLSLAHEALGFTLLLRGELPSARTHVEQALALYDPQTPPHLPMGRADSRMDCLRYASWTLWYLGYPDQGLQRSREVVALAAKLSDPYSLAHALIWAAHLHLLRREEQLARERAEAAMTLATEQGFPLWVAGATSIQGSALAEQGRGKDGLAQMQQALSALQALGAEAGRLLCLGYLARAYAKVGHVEAGLSVVAEALALVDKTGQRMEEAELYRLQGQLTLQQVTGHSAQCTVPGPQAKAEAEACFHKAIEIARQQQAKSLELRAVMSLARLWQQQGKQQEAHQLLSEIYAWFTEGFDTKDLQEAKALLEELEEGV